MSAPSSSPDPVLVMSGDIDVVSEHTWRRAGEQFLADHPDLQDLTEDEIADNLPTDDLAQTLTELREELKKLSDG